MAYTRSRSSQGARTTQEGPIAVKIEAAEEGGYFARAIGHSIFTQGETLDAVKKNIEEAVHCHFGRCVPIALLDEKKTTTEDPKP